MDTGKTVFSQLMDAVPTYKFRKIVTRHKGNYRVRSFSCWDQLLCMCFRQFTFRESLRDLISTLNTLGGRRYYLGLKNQIPLSTISDANASRPWQMYQELAMVLVDQDRKLYQQENSDLEDLLESVYALDSTTDRSVPVAVSLGRISIQQSRYKASHAYGSGRINTNIHPHFRRPNA